MASQGSPRTIYVSVDFGTTFSGVAWSQTARPDVQTAIIQWPNAFSTGLEGITSEKVPTELRHDDTTELGYRWGFQIKDFEDRPSCFKAGLDPEQVRTESELARMYPDQHSLPPPYDSSVEKLVIDYMKALRKHVVDILIHKLGAHIVTSTPFSFIVTTPAIWSPRAMQKTRNCAKEAGFGSDVRIISEPEAAAIHSLDMMDPHGIQVGETFVVCDAGGGTVDLITYEVEELQPTLKIKEATSGKGSWCGSTFLNRIFQAFLEKKFKMLRGWDEETMEEALDKFEKTTKRTYGGDLNDEFVIPLSGLRDNPHIGVKRGKYRMSGSEVGAFFEPVVKQVIALVAEQITQSRTRPKSILLVGGFGQNAFLRNEIRRAFPNIDVAQPANGWTAVVRGALTKAMAEASPNDCKVSIASRVARKSYGTPCQAPFEEGKHDAHKKYWSGRDGFYRIGIIEWIVKKGDSIKEIEPITAEFSYNHLVSEGGFRANKIIFYSCTNTEAPLYEGHIDAKPLVTLNVDLSTIPIIQLRRIHGFDGKYYHKVEFQIKVTFFSAHTDYALWVGSKCFGSVQAEYA